MRNEHCDNPGNILSFPVHQPLMDGIHNRMTDNQKAVQANRKRETGLLKQPSQYQALAEKLITHDSGFGIHVRIILPSRINRLGPLALPSSPTRLRFLRDIHRAA